MGVPVFICPGCAVRQQRGERTVGHQPRGCERCGFGFVFELLEDYYPGPKTALVVCDRDGRVIAAGHNTTAVTGFREPDLLGGHIIRVLGITPTDGVDAIARALEWGVRVLDAPCTFRPNAAREDRPATLDCFPAYDDDSGLLVALTPR